jgi:hypothetical protein
MLEVYYMRKAVDEFLSLDVSEMLDDRQFSFTERMIDLFRPLGYKDMENHLEFMETLLAYQTEMRNEDQTSANEMKYTLSQLQDKFSEIKVMLNEELASRRPTRRHRVFLQSCSLTIDRCLTWLDRKDPGPLPDLPHVKSYLNPFSYFKPSGSSIFSRNSAIDNSYCSSRDGASKNDDSINLSNMNGPFSNS